MKKYFSALMVMAVSASTLAIMAPALAHDGGSEFESGKGQEVQNITSNSNASISVPSVQLEDNGNLNNSGSNVSGVRGENEVGEVNHGSMTSNEVREDNHGSTTSSIEIGEDNHGSGNSSIEVGEDNRVNATMFSNDNSGQGLRGEDQATVITSTIETSNALRLDDKGNGDTLPLTTLVSTKDSGNIALEDNGQQTRNDNFMTTFEHALTTFENTLRDLFLGHR